MNRWCLHDRYEEAQSLGAEDAADEGAADEDVAVDDGARAGCAAHTRKGTPCKNKVVRGTDYCRVHQHLAEQDTQLRDVAQIMRELTR
jgi:hypothetical protein